MQKIYLLIQNDIETGPYALQELLQLPLKNDNLIWEIGQSEDWLSPLKVPSLQPYLTHNADALVKPEVIAAIQDNRFIGATATAAATVSQRPAAGFLDTRFLTQATVAKAKPQPINTKPATPLKESGIKKYLAKLQQVAPKKKSEPVNEIESEEGESRRLPLLGIVAAVVLLFGWSAYYHKDNKAPAAVAQSVPATPAGPADSYEPQTTENVAAPLPEPIAQVETFSDAAGVTALPPSEVPVDAYLDSVQKVIAAQDNIDAQNQAYLNKASNSSRKLPQKMAARSGTKPYPQQQAAVVARVPLHQQVALHTRYLQAGGKKLSGVEVGVKNNSNTIMKKISVDVFYYRKGDKLFDKETVYFNNVHPHQSQTLSIPGNKKATSARFQLGVVTGTDGY